MKSFNASSNSWVPYIRNILAIFDLPSIHDIIKFTPTKTAWKNKYSKAINHKWLNEAKQIARNHPSLVFMNLDICKVGKPHPVIELCPPDHKETPRMMVKLRMITGTYSLQANRARFNQFEVNPTCRLCNTDVEDRSHFIAVCPALAHIRTPFLNDLNNALRNVLNESDCDSVLGSVKLLTQLIIDPTSDMISSLAIIGKRDINNIEMISRRLLLALHSAHTKLIKTKS